MDTVELTAEQSSEIDELEKMFETTGWQVFLRAQQDVLNDFIVGAIERTHTPEQYWAIKGSIAILRSVLGYENEVAARKASWVRPDVDHDPVP